MPTDHEALPHPVRAMLTRPVPPQLGEFLAALNAEAVTLPGHEIPETLAAEVDEHAEAVAELQSGCSGLTTNLRRQLKRHLAFVTGEADEGPTADELFEFAAQRRPLALELVGECVTLNRRAVVLCGELDAASRAWAEGAEAELEKIKAGVRKALRDAGQGEDAQPCYANNRTHAKRLFEELVMSNSRVKPIADQIAAARELMRQRQNDSARFSKAAKEAAAILEVMAERLLSS